MWDDPRDGSLQGAGGRGGAKKECLFLTNKATILLKIKDRENEQSQTKPIFGALVGKQILQLQEVAG